MRLHLALGYYVNRKHLNGFSKFYYVDALANGIPFACRLYIWQIMLEARSGRFVSSMRVCGNVKYRLNDTKLCIDKVFI